MSPHALLERVSKRIAVVALVALAAAAQPSLRLGAERAVAAEGGSTNLYGVIEIGSKGVKAYLFDLDRAETDPACSEQDDTYLKCLDAKILPQVNVNPLEEQSIGKTAQVVADMYGKMSATNHVAPERLFIVGSSGIVHLAFKDTLIAAVKGKLPHLVHPVDFVTVDQEATFDFQGVLGMLPHRWRRLRQHQAAVIDIGSGNIKASFMSDDGGTPKVVTFGIDYGTKRATDEINQLRGDMAFPQAAGRWRTAALVPALRAQLDDYPGFGNRNRVYLVGGIVWAMENMTHPEDKSKFPPIRPITIDKFLATVSTPEGAASVCSDEAKAKFQDVGKACDVFSADNLVAGTELLKGLSDELGFVRARKSLFFFRDSLYAWPLGYLRDKVYGSENP